MLLEFTPLEFETDKIVVPNGGIIFIRIYSVGVWNIAVFGFVCFVCVIRIYSVGVWNYRYKFFASSIFLIRIYSVGVWNSSGRQQLAKMTILEFTPLEFETAEGKIVDAYDTILLEFTPLEFETKQIGKLENQCLSLEFTPLEFETIGQR